MNIDTTKNNILIRALHILFYTKKTNKLYQVKIKMRFSEGYF